VRVCSTVLQHTIKSCETKADGKKSELRDLFVHSFLRLHLGQWSKVRQRPESQSLCCLAYAQLSATCQAFTLCEFPAFYLSLCHAHAYQSYVNAPWGTQNSGCHQDENDFLMASVATCALLYKCFCNYMQYAFVHLHSIGTLQLCNCSSSAQNMYVQEIMHVDCKRPNFAPPWKRQSDVTCLYAVRMTNDLC
jgi:hypothetical protein